MGGRCASVAVALGCARRAAPARRGASSSVRPLLGAAAACRRVAAPAGSSPRQACPRARPRPKRRPRRAPAAAARARRGRASARASRGPAFGTDGSAAHEEAGGAQRGGAVGARGRQQVAHAPGRHRAQRLPHALGQHVRVIFLIHRGHAGERLDERLGVGAAERGAGGGVGDRRKRRLAQRHPAARHARRHVALDHPRRKHVNDLRDVDVARGACTPARCWAPSERSNKVDSSAGRADDPSSGPIISSSAGPATERRASAASNK